MDQIVTKNVHNLLAYQLEGPGIQVEPDNSVSQLESIISNVIGVITIVAFIFFTFQIIFAGYAFISANGDEKKLETSRKKLTNGILGLTIVVVAYGLTAFIANLLGLDNVFSLQSLPFFRESTSPGYNPIYESTY